MRRQGIRTLGNSFRELVRFNGGEEGVFNAPGEVDGLGQGRYAHAQLTRSGVLEDASSAYSRVGRPRGKPSKLKQGVKPGNCQGSEFLLGLMLGEPASWHPIGSREGASAGHPHLRYLGLELSLTLLPTNPESLWSHPCSCTSSPGPPAGGLGIPVHIPAMTQVMAMGWPELACFTSMSRAPMLP